MTLNESQESKQMDIIVEKRKEKRGQITCEKTIVPPQASVLFWALWNGADTCFAWPSTSELTDRFSEKLVITHHNHSQNTHSASYSVSKEQKTAFLHNFCREDSCSNQLGN